MPLPAALAPLATKAGLGTLLSKIGGALFGTKLSTAATTYFGSKLIGL